MPDAGYRMVGMPCRFCHDTTGACEHVCQSCDKIVENGTCNNGRCEECCSVHCGEDPITTEDGVL